MSALAEKSGAKMNFNPGEGLGKAMSNLADALYRAGHTTYIKAVTAAKTQLGPRWDEVKQFFKPAWDAINKGYESGKDKILGKIPGVKQDTEFNIHSFVDFNTAKANVVNGQWKDPFAPAVAKASQLLTKPIDNIKTAITKVNQNLFGDQQFIQTIQRHMPLAWNAYKEINAQLRLAERLERAWVNFYDPLVDTFSIKDVNGLLKYWDDTVAKGPGVENPKDWKDVKAERGGIGPIAHLQPREHPLSVNVLWRKDTANLEDVVKVHELFKQSFADGISLRTTFEAKRDTLTDTQQKMFVSAAIMYHRQGSDSLIKHPRLGWFYAGRKGDFAVVVRDETGNAHHLEFFRTQAEADHFSEQVKSTTTYVPDGYNKKDSIILFEAVNKIDELLSTNQTPQQQRLQQDIQDLRERMARNAGLGSHDKHRLGLPGYEGTKWFKTKADNADAFRQSVFNGAQEYATLYKKRALSTIAEPYLRDPELKKLVPEQTKVIDELFNNAMNQPKEIQQKIEEVGKIADEAITKAMLWAGKDAPQVSLPGKVHGSAATLFYIAALNTRPAFWASNILTAPFAIRHILKDGDWGATVVARSEALVSLGTGGPAWFKQAMTRLREESHTLVPQFTNDYTNIGGPLFDRGHHVRMRKGMEWLTGQTPSAMADATSRYIVASIGLHYYKNKGMSMDEVLRNTMEFVDSTMVQYGRQHTPPFLQKMGWVGQAIAPLMKYPMAQMGNMVADIQHIKDKKTMKSTLPLISTLATSAIVGGSTGWAAAWMYNFWATVFNAGLAMFSTSEEYEETRMKTYDELLMTNENMLNEALEAGYKYVGMENPEDAAEYGLASQIPGLDGYDLGSGVRFQSPGGALLDSNKSLTSIFTVIQHSADMAKSFWDLSKGAATSTKDKITGGMDQSMTSDQARTTALKHQFMVGQRAMMDRTMFDSGTRNMVPENATELNPISSGKVKQTPQEEIATALGTKTTSTKRELDRLNYTTEKVKGLEEKLKHKVAIAYDNTKRGKPVRWDLVFDAAMKTGSDPANVFDQFLRWEISKNMDRETLFQIGSDLSLSDKEIAKIIQYNKTR